MIVGGHAGPRRATKLLIDQHGEDAGLFTAYSFAIGAEIFLPPLGQIEDGYMRLLTR